MSESVMKIGNKEVNVREEELRVSDLKFYSSNPRIYSIINNNGEEPSQDDIAEVMFKFEHVKELKSSIESNGGLIDPLIVRDRDFVVLEGNSRLAAYKLLSQTPAGLLKWGKVPCKILPFDISDSLIFALLCQYHIIGRKDWEPFEQAHYLYRRHTETNIPIKHMAKELGLGEKKAEKLIDVIKFMINHDDLKKNHWSYYEEYLKNKPLEKYRETLPNLDETIVKEVKNGGVKQASDIRKLGAIAKLNDKQSKKLINKFSNEECSLDDAYNEIKETGKLDDIVKKLKTFKELINDNNILCLLTTSDDVMEKSEYEIKKILKRLEEIYSKMHK